MAVPVNGVEARGERRTQFKLPTADAEVATDDRLDAGFRGILGEFQGAEEVVAVGDGDRRHGVRLGERHELGSQARGNRDQSWGPRRWGGPKMWRWFSINIDDDTHFGGIRIGTDAGDLHRGWVWRDGAAASIRQWDVRTTLADDGLTHRVTDVRATDARGRVHALRADLPEGSLDEFWEHVRLVLQVA